jgi:RimJ/RimL family protein N-acetyltransferase
MPTDAAALRELRLEALRLHPEAFSADVTTNEREPLSFWVERASHAADDPEQVIYFAVVDGELIGMAGVRRGASPKTAHSAILWGVYVRPAWRGQRIVDQLVQGVLGWAGQQQVQLVKLAVIVTNTTAIRSYRRCGFSVYGVEPQAICYNGRCYDELLMVQQL